MKNNYFLFTIILLPLISQASPQILNYQGSIIESYICQNNICNKIKTKLDQTACSITVELQSPQDTKSTALWNEHLPHAKNGKALIDNQTLNYNHGQKAYMYQSQKFAAYLTTSANDSKISVLYSYNKNRSLNVLEYIYYQSTNPKLKSYAFLCR